MEPFFARCESGHCTAGSTLPPGPLQPWPRPLASTPTPTECRTSISAHTHANTPATAAVATGGAPTLQSLFRRPCGQTWLPPHSCSRTSISPRTHANTPSTAAAATEGRQPCIGFSGDYAGRAGFRRTPVAGPASVLTHTQTRHQWQRLQREERQPCIGFSGDHVGRSGFRRTPVAGPASVLTHSKHASNGSGCNGRSANLAVASPALMRADPASAAFL